MNRQQRRAANSKGSLGALRGGIERLHEQAGGLLELRVVDQAVMLELLLAALAGDTDAAAIARIVTDTVAKIERAATTGRPGLCASCPRELTDARYTPVIAIPRCDSPRDALGIAVCRECATTPDQVLMAASAALRRIWPGLRPITVTHPEGGRA